MATTPTSIGPIGARQINRTLYVGQSDLTTIQSAVNAAARIGGAFVVAIPFDYAGSDAISAVTGGSTSIEIIDRRQGQIQTYVWNGASYIPADFNQLGDIRAISGHFGGSVSAQQDLACGADLIVEGNANIWSDTTIGGSAAITGDATIGGDITAVAATFDEATVDESPVRTFANTPDGPGQGMVWPTIGIPVSLGDHWQNPSIDPATLATYPAAGVPVSTGTAWSTPIPAADIARKSQANTFNADQTVVGNINVTQVVESAGVSVASPSTATAGIVTALQPNLATGNITSLNIGKANSPGEIVELGFQATASGGNGVIGMVAGATTIFDFQGSWLFPTQITASLVNAWSATGANVLSIGQSTGVPNPVQMLMGVSSTGGTGGIGTGLIDAVHQGISYCDLLLSTRGGNVTIGTSSTANSIPGLITCANTHLRIGDRPAATWSTGSPNINVDNNFGSLAMSAGGTGAIYMNWDQGTGGVIFGNGGPSQVAKIDNGGALVCSGSVTGGSGFILPSTTNNFVISQDGGSTFIDGGAGGRLLLNTHRAGGVVEVTGTFNVLGTKNFVVRHPLLEGKDLIHSCLEGPEIGVYYRGEVTTENGKAEVTLPDYFEALTFPEDRSVLLTQIYEEEDEGLTLLAASRVKDGKFRIRSSVATATVAWEVKAVRRLDVDRLKVVADTFQMPEVTEKYPESTPH